MLSTSARLLRLASLLQARRHWSGQALAAELGVDARTVRRDVGRLRELGYPVNASAGVGGGYALGRGADLPPLMLDDEEAVTLSIALRVATNAIGGMEDHVVRLLAKLEQLLPTRLRRRAASLQSMTLALPAGASLVDAGTLARLATACRDRVSLRFDYSSHAGVRSRRSVEPLRLANHGRRWYLIAWDEGRGDWRTFRIDRIEGRIVARGTFAPRPLPPDAAERLQRGIAYEPFACRVTLRLDGTLPALRAAIPAWVGILEADGDGHCLLRIGSDTPDGLVAHLASLGRSATLVEDYGLAPEIRAVLARIGGLVGPWAVAG
jgi:predicted DNA-binding transcriptional regulator YafY